MSELFLILHKVRGQPAFDVAQRFSFGDEEGWLIPTSGHRAHPLTWTPVEMVATCEGPAWASLPDHYTASEPRTLSRKQVKPASNLRGILAEIGLGGKARPKMKMKVR